jgi:hypothetical protein
MCRIPTSSLTFTMPWRRLSRLRSELSRSTVQLSRFSLLSLSLSLSLALSPPLAFPPLTLSLPPPPQKKKKKV